MYLSFIFYKNSYLFFPSKLGNSKIFLSLLKSEIIELNFFGEIAYKLSKNLKQFLKN